MALPNPWYVDQNAVHQPSTSRMLSYGMTTGQQGVLGNDDLRVVATGTPSNRIQVMPGAYMVRAKHLGGSYEGYAGKLDVAELSDIINPTDSTAGGRYDLVILQVQNPYVSGSGTYPIPADPAGGPYARIVVLEGGAVTQTTWDVAQYSNTWSAITLAKIWRPPNTGVINPGDITNLRSLAALGGTRTVVIENPPTVIPPVAQSFYMNFKASPIDPNYAKPTGGTDNTHDYLVADTATKNWPAVATWQDIAVPDWAVECDAEFQVNNAQILDGDVFGDLWLDFGGTATTAQTYAIDYDGTPGRWVVPYGLTFKIPSTLRGKVITVRTKFKSRFTAPGRLDAKTGTTTKLALNFQRVAD